MNRTRVLIQLLIFGVIAVLVFAYTFFDVLGVKLTSRPFSIKVELIDGGGIFEGSEVAYRGVAVGKVKDVVLNTSGVTLTLSINDGTKIPVNSIAHVYSLSAVGEQYLDFEPQPNPGAVLRAGAVVPASQTTAPLQISTALYGLEQLIDSIHPEDLQIIGSQGAAALGGAGDALRTIVSDTTSVVNQLSSSEDALLQLLPNASVLLQGAAAHASDFESFSNSLLALSGTLASSTPEITQFLNQAAPTTTLINNVMQANGNNLITATGDIATLSSIAYANLPGIKALLAAIPEFAGLSPKIVTNGNLNLLVLLNLDNPVCSTGVALTSPISGTRTPLKNAGCTSSNPNVLARGAGNAPGAAAAGVASNDASVLTGAGATSVWQSLLLPGAGR